jgi:SNF2 family DNA or RNA helicase
LRSFADLRDYQRRMIEHMMQNERCAVWADMGLGKTVTTLTAIQQLLYAFETKGVLVVAPLRVARKTWTDEITEWAHLRGLTVSKIIGDDRQRRAAVRKKADIHTINRENLEWLVMNHFKQHVLETNADGVPTRLRYEYVVPWRWKMVVLDESSSFKNPEAKRTVAMKLVNRYVDRMVQLTGTPSPNGLPDLWSQLYLLDGGERLGRTRSAFLQRWFNPPTYEMGRYEPKTGADDEIHRRVGDICISLRDTDYLDLPPMMFNNVVVEFSDALMKRYRDFQRTLVMELASEVITAANAGVLWNKLLQFANGAMYYGESRAWEHIHDAKLDALLELHDTVSSPMIIAYTYDSDRQRIEAALTKKKVRWRTLRTEDDENAWNRGEVDRLIMHPASGGHGLNIHKNGAETIVFFGVTPNLELYEQMVARLGGGHRRVGKNVVIHHLMVEGTQDFRALDLLQMKGDTQRALMAATRALVEDVLGVSPALAEPPVVPEVAY